MESKKCDKLRSKKTKVEIEKAKCDKQLIKWRVRNLFLYHQNNGASYLQNVDLF